MAKTRCAIYTRKSSEEGLEQDFNSLDAQHAACAAYISSQTSEGWSLVKTRYDDGGISGGTLERPGLQQLLADIADKKIDIVVVYKVDRLTRSLLDFSKLVEAFDKAGVSFVSITQSFNTTTSMGRLTLNMLLSFAQFEREVTAERIRDKIAASKARGMWMGGTPPLGYAPDGRTLKIVEEHAKLIGMIFDRYLKLGSVRLLAEALQLEEIKVPIRTTSAGRSFGGGTFMRGQLYLILNNPIYMGKIRHKSAQGEKLYNGNQPVIIAQDLWDQVQARLAAGIQGARGANGPDATHAALGAEGDQDARKVQTAVGVNFGQGDSASRSGARHAISQSSQISLLAGKLFDDMGQPLVATHACKPARSGSDGNKIRYRYYVSRHLQHGDAAARDGSAATARLGGPPHTGRTFKDFDAATPHGLRIPAREVEQLVVDCVAAAITDPLALIERMGAPLPDNADLAAMTTTGNILAEHLKTAIPAHIHSLLASLIDRIIVRHDEIQIMLNPLVLLQLFKLPQPNDVKSVVLALPVKLKRAGMAMKMILPNGSAAVQRLPDTILIGAIKRGRAWWYRLQHERGLTVEALARDQKLSPTYITRQIKLAFLDPQIINGILRGDVPAGLTVDRLEKIAANHTSWADQRTALQRADQ